MTENKPTETPPLETDSKAPLLTPIQWLLCGGGLVALIAVSIVVTLLLSPSGGKPETLVEKTRQVQPSATMEARLRQSELQQAQLMERLAILEATPPPAAIPPALLARLNDQEHSFQQFLETLEQGMGELSRMVQGSRDWLELYSEELEALKNQSQQRQQELQALGTGTVE
ncbi:MAG: hypothetical protein EA349_11085 [Halomonadaceae bacterium]|nr:MAG: hypothetical protein EA349_11085 [Halomonadaceae bacterium]